MNRLEMYNEYLVMTSCYYMFMYSSGLLLMANPNPDSDEGDNAIDN